MLSASELNQLTLILLLATILFVLASALPQKVATSVLLMIAPFQLIDTRFGTSSIVLAYVVFIAALLRKERMQLPMLPHFLFLLLWYMISMSLMEPSTYIQHGVYLFSLVSAFLVFWLCYDLVNRFQDPSKVVTVFIVANVFVLIYCAIQLWIGPGERMYLFGIRDIYMTRVRADGRLTGPFESAEITAQYLVLMQFLLIHQFWHAKPGLMRKGIAVIGALNVLCLLATGSRGEFLLLVGGLGLYLWFFRRRLGTARAAALACGMAVTLLATALILENFTQFGGLFDRLQRTEFTEEGIPDTRALLWPQAWREIQNAPIIGHGPRLRFFLEGRGIIYDNHVYIDYPHNLYLYLLFTVGIPGMLLFLWLVGSVAIRCAKAMKRATEPSYSADLARTGVLLVILFLIDGLKIDQMRLNLADYWHFFFGLCGVLIAVCHRIESQVAAEASSSRVYARAAPSMVPAHARESLTNVTASR